MCAPFTLRHRLNLVIQELADLLPRHPGLFDWDPTPAFNICPPKKVAAVRPTADASGRETVPLKWGLIPFWSKAPKIATSCINARGETVAEKPAFRNGFKKRRCLILVDGNYEWTGKPGKKQPWHFRLPGDVPFAFAGLWECWRLEDEEPVETCTIVTTSANEFSAKYHDRMPVIIDAGDYYCCLTRHRRPTGCCRCSSRGRSPGWRSSPSTGRSTTRGTKGRSCWHRRASDISTAG